MREASRISWLLCVYALSLSLFENNCDQVYTVRRAICQIRRQDFRVRVALSSPPRLSCRFNTSSRFLQRLCLNIRGGTSDCKPIENREDLRGSTNSTLTMFFWSLPQDCFSAQSRWDFRIKIASFWTWRKHLFLDDMNVKSLRSTFAIKAFFPRFFSEHPTFFSVCVCVCVIWRSVLIFELSGNY